MTDLKSSFPSRSDVLAVFRQELARAAAVPGLAAGPALLPRFAGYLPGPGPTAAARASSCRKTASTSERDGKEDLRSVIAAS